MQVRNKCDGPAGKVTGTGQSVFFPPINTWSDTRPNTPHQAVVKQFTHNKVIDHEGSKPSTGCWEMESLRLKV